MLADTHCAIMLRETQIPPRWYVPHDDVRTEVLSGSRSSTTCPSKGHASYVSIAPGVLESRPGGVADVAWTYPHPYLRSRRSRGCSALYAERTDLVFAGIPQPRPITRWSSPEDQERL